ncbi:MAG: hypothetical protein E7647_04390 [Ruminococcaceae bacterium]|nr:hypothetical protein [Oscillospiraceae bacterium]
MSKQTLRCPNCNKNIGTVSEGEYLYGSPLRTCPKCKKLYHDPRYHEIAIEGIRREDIDPDSEYLAGKRKSGFLSILGGIGVMVAFVVLIFLGRIFYFFPVISVMLIASGISTLSSTTGGAVEKKKIQLQQEATLSRARMQNPQYVAQLRSLGYNVPDTNYQQ